MPYVFSKITNDTVYADYAYNPGGGLPTITKQVKIKGGANRADKHIITPQGVMTEVTDEELEFLLKNDGFQRHVERGFITHKAYKADADKVAKDMAERDNSSPLTPQDFTEEGGHPAVQKQPSAANDDIESKTRTLLQKLTGAA